MQASFRQLKTKWEKVQQVKSRQLQSWEGTCPHKTEALAADTLLALALLPSTLQTYPVRRELH